MTTRVAVCTPCMDGRAHIPYFRSLEAALPAARKAGIQISWLTTEGCANLPRARNLLVAQALHLNMDVFFVDSDVGFEAEDFVRICERPEPVVAGVIQARSKQWNEPPRLAVKLIEPAIMKDGLLEAELAATAFLRIKREVFAEMVEKGLADKFEYPHASPEINARLNNFFWYDLNEYEPGLKQDDGEDHYFCRQWRKAGGKVFVDVEVRLRHYCGMVAHPLALKDFLQAAPQEAPSEEAA